MGKQEFKDLLEGMVNNADIAERVEGGDFTDLAAGELTGAEQALLSAAAGELGEHDVSGFAAYIKFDGVKGEPPTAGWKVEEGTAYTDAGRVTFDGPRMTAALNFLKP